MFMRVRVWGHLYALARVCVCPRISFMCTCACARLRVYLLACVGTQVFRMRAYACACMCARTCLCVMASVRALARDCACSHVRPCLRAERSVCVG